MMDSLLFMDSPQFARGFPNENVKVTYDEL